MSGDIDLDPGKSRGCFDCQNVATKLLVQWRQDWHSEEIGFAVCFGAKRMETHINVAGAFIEIALCWSVVLMRRIELDY